MPYLTVTASFGKSEEDFYLKYVDTVLKND